MKLYLLTQDVNNGYDTYDSCVVIADNEDTARKITPETYRPFSEELDAFAFEYADGKREIDGWGSWAKHPREVKVQYLGEAKEGSEPGVVCASFNAG